MNEGVYMYKRNYVKLRGNENCPLHYLIPRESQIKNVYEVVGCDGSELDRNYKRISLQNSRCFDKLTFNVDYLLNSTHFQYIKKRVSDNISISLIIEYA